MKRVHMARHDYLTYHLRLVHAMALTKAITSGLVGRLVGRSRSFHATAITCGTDGREKRLGHKEESDKLEGEVSAYAASQQSYELVDENLMDKVINNVKFKDIPIVYIRCTRNNTKITLQRGDGQTIAHKSGGTEGYKNCRKGTTVAAQAVANRILMIASDNQINMARIVFNGLGPGRNAAFKVFEMNNFNAVSLTDRTEAVEPWFRRPRGAKSI